MKAGLFPLHIWLPSAHANAPSHVSAILSGVTIKMGIYGLVRFSGWLPVPPGAGWVVAALGVVSAVLGVAFALGQHDLKRLLAYHSVENIGIILIGLGFALVAVEQGDAAWGRLALAGGLLACLESRPVQGAVVLRRRLGAARHRHARDEPARRAVARDAVDGRAVRARRGGDFRSAAAERFCQRVARLSRACSMPTISRGPSAWAAIPAAILLGVTGALALACFVKVCGVVFLGAPRSPAAAHAHECGPAMRGAMLVLAAACVAIGLAPVVFWPAVARAVGAWHPVWAGLETPAPLVALGWVHVALAVLAAAAGWWLWRRAQRQRLDARADLGLRLRGADRAHAIHGGFVRRHHHRMVCVDSAAGTPRASAGRIVPDRRRVLRSTRRRRCWNTSSSRRRRGHAGLARRHDDCSTGACSPICFIC